MTEGADHYAVLGLKPTATATEIKAAYHRRAKAAHPDTGGSVETMAQINEAYQTLSSSVERRTYDERRAAETTSRHQAEHPATPRSDEPHHASGRHPAGEQRSAHHETNAHINRERYAWARHSAWEMFRINTPIAIVTILVTRFIITHASGNITYAAALVAFVPVYFVALSIIFLFSPPLRLVFADLVRRYPTTKQERISALALVLAPFPLAAIWVFLFTQS